MKRMFAVLVVVMLIVPAASLAKKSKDLTGTYAVTGYNPGMSTSGDPSYIGTLEVAQTGGAYKLDWSVGHGGKQHHKGVGIYSDGIFSVAFDGGVVSYKVEGDTMKGVWSPFKGGLFGYEICEKRK